MGIFRRGLFESRPQLDIANLNRSIDAESISTFLQKQKLKHADLFSPWFEESAENILEYEISYEACPALYGYKPGCPTQPGLCVLSKEFLIFGNKGALSRSVTAIQYKDISVLNISRRLRVHKFMLYTPGFMFDFATTGAASDVALFENQLRRHLRHNLSR